MKDKTLYDLVVGDDILIKTRSLEYIASVAKITKSTIISNNGLKFRKIDGRCVPFKPWNISSASVVTDKNRERLHEESVIKLKIRKIKSIDFDKLSNEKIDSIYNILLKNNKANKNN